MEGTVKIKWWQSKIVRTAGVLLAGSLVYLGITVGYFDPADYERAVTVYPEVERGIDLVRAGQVLAGITAILSPLAAYFRVFKSSRLIDLK